MLYDFWTLSFGIRAWFQVCKLGSTYRCLKRMSVRSHEQESSDEQKFATVPAIFAPLKPIHEGVQAEFDG